MKKTSLPFLLAALIACTVLSCTNNGMNMKKMDETLAKNKAVVAKLDAAFDVCDTMAVDSLISPDMVDHTPPPGMKGDAKQVLHEIMRDFHTAFPDGKSTIIALLADSDYVSSYGTFTGTNTGPLMGMPPCNLKMSFDFSDVFKLKDGKITDHWGLIDMMAIMNHPGMMPPKPMSADSMKAMKKKM